LEEKFAAGSVVYVEPAGLGGFADRFDCPAFVLNVEQYWRTGCIIAPQIVGYLLVIPAQFASTGIDGNNQNRMEVVARPGDIVHLRCRIAGAQIEQTQFRIEGGRRP
jgi:hypothetical protein